jgi:predicted short-subunit dehydrogenase-like oxidoreductase (DUF2520 family)
MPRKPAKPSITIVGPGRFGSALALALYKAGYTVDEIVTRRSGQARGLASKIKAKAVALDNAALEADIIWLTVQDSAIGLTANQLAANRGDWSKKIAFHSSGALTSDELSILKEHDAAVASVHPMMTFSGGPPPSLVDVFFGVEGDPRAIRVAKSVVQTLGAISAIIRPEDKPAYHALGSFASPLFIALLAAAEQVGSYAGFDRRQIRDAIGPLLQQTLDNYVAQGAAAAFTGPLVRGDAETIRKHLDALQFDPTVRDAYLALAHAALKYLPVGHAEQIATLLNQPRSPGSKRT